MVPSSPTYGIIKYQSLTYNIYDDILESHINTHNSAVNLGCFVPCNIGSGASSSPSVFAKLDKVENSNLAR